MKQEITVTSGGKTRTFDSQAAYESWKRTAMTPATMGVNPIAQPAGFGSSAGQFKHLSREEPVLLATTGSHFFVPFLWSLVPGMVVVIATEALVQMFWPETPKLWAVPIILGSLTVGGIFMLIVWKSMGFKIVHNKVEGAEGHDLVKPSEHVTHTTKVESTMHYDDRGDKSTYREINEPPELVGEVFRACLSDMNRMKTNTRLGIIPMEAWVGRGKPLSRDRHKAIIKFLVQNGWAELKNENTPDLGYKLTEEGSVALQDWLKDNESEDTN